MAIITPLKKRWLWQCWRTETNGSCATGGGGTSLLYKEVPISSAEILTIGTIKIELLPALSSGEYYDNVKINLEYNHVTTEYADPNGVIYIQSSTGASGPFSAFTDSPLTNPYSSVCQVTVQPLNNLTIDSTSRNSFTFSNDITGTNFSDLVMFMSGAKTPPFNPSAGDGTMLVKIWYEIRTVGSEL